MADIGGVTLSRRTANGSADGGLPIRLAVTVLINAPVRMPLTADGTALAELITTGAVTLESRTSTGEATQGSVSSGDVSLENRYGRGYGPNVSDFVRSPITATGTARNGSISTGVVVLRNRTITASASGVNPAFGTAVRQTTTALGIATQQTLVTTSIILLRRQATGTALNGSVAIGSVEHKAITASGTAVSQNITTGAPVRTFARLNGYSEQAIEASYRTWVANVENEALTEYTNFPFNSYATFNNKHYAAGPNGIFELTGTKDNTADIVWVVRTGFHDDKNVQLKRLQELFMGIRFDGPVRVRVWTNENVFYDYTLANYTETLQQVRVKLGKGLKSKYYRIELTGMDGAKFELDNLEIPMMPVARRIGNGS